MNLPVDISSFPTGGESIDYEDQDEVARLDAMTQRARRFVEGLRGSPPIADLIFAFGVAPIICLYLVRFTTAIVGGELDGETEFWIVVGDLPSMYFDAEVAPTPDLAVQLYCAIAQDWADNVLAGRDLSESFPIPVAPTRKHAKMLKGRIRTLRRDYVPLARLPRLERSLN